MCPSLPSMLQIDCILAQSLVSNRVRFQRVYFDHSVFHPLVSPEAPFEMDIKRGPLKKWRRNVNHIWQILHLVRRNFYRVETNNPLNHEAARSVHATLCTRNDKVVEIRPNKTHKSVSALILPRTWFIQEFQCSKFVRILF